MEIVAHYQRGTGMIRIIKERRNLRKSIKKRGINNCKWYYSNKKMRSLLFSFGMGSRHNVTPIKFYRNGEEMNIPERINPLNYKIEGENL